jgi:hypothetical protein
MTDKYDEMCRKAREKFDFEPETDESAICEYCLAKYECEV